MVNRRRVRGTRVRSAPAWLFGAAACFLLYFGVLVYCDVLRRDPSGVLVAFDEQGAVVAGVVPASHAEVAGLRPGDRIASYLDRPVRSRLDWTGVEANLATGAPVVIAVERAGERHRIVLSDVLADRRWESPEPRTLALWFSRLVQLVCLVFAGLVVFKRPHDRFARLAAWMLASLGVYTVVLPFGFAHYWRQLPPPLPWLMWVPYVSSMGLALVFFVFCAEFPQPLLGRRWPLLALCVPGAIGLAWITAFGVLVVHGEARTSIGADLTSLIIPLWAIYLAGGLALLWLQYRRLDDPNERRRLRLLLAGAAIGCASGVLVQIEFWIFSSPQLTHSVFNSPATMAGMLLILAFPASVAYAVPRHRLFDVDFIVRRGVQYALARRLLLLLVPALLVLMVADVFAHRAAPPGEILRARGWFYVASAGALIVTLVNRRRWLEHLDRRFFRERYHSEHVLRNVAEKLRHATDPTSATSAVVHEIALALQPSFAGALGAAPGAKAFAVLAATASFPAQFRLSPAGKLVGLARVVGGALQLSPDHDAWIAEHLPRHEAEAVFDAQVELLIPVTLEEGREVVLLLGPRRSEEPYSRLDIDLLEAVASSLGLLLDRAGAVGATPAAGEGEVACLAECPVCAKCFDTGRARCPDDGTLLMASDLPPVLASRYRLEARLGAGGMGTVYAARDQTLGRYVAVKVIGDHLVGSREAARRFRREAETAASFTHPNVVTIHDIGVTATGRAFLVMERLEGRTLREEIERTGALPVDRVARVVADVCRVLEDAHGRGLVHRDLKPENVFLARAGDVELTKLFDFGIATLLAGGPGGTTSTQSSAVFGSLPYMSPEQLRGEPVSPLWDLWALGVMTLEMLTGARPDGPSGPLRTRPPGARLPADEERIATFRAVALAEDVALRPRSAREFHDCLLLALRQWGR